MRSPDSGKTDEELHEFYTSPEQVEELLSPPQSYGNGYQCCRQQIALATELRVVREENKKFREFIKGVKLFDPRSDIYATGLMDECNDVLGLCRCCGQEKCDEV